jgi:hypothetical protein
MGLTLKGIVILVCLATVVTEGCGGTEGHKEGETVQPQVNYAPWPMHPIDSRFRGANALSPGDVNKDGFLDYVTNYEFDQRYVVTLHPGSGGNVKAPWPAVVAWKPEPLVNGNGVDPEHSALGDFDGDGNLDVVAAQGVSAMPFWEGSEPGIRLIWGPPADRVLDEAAWVDAGRIPATIDRGHMIYVAPYDINGDGATDIVSGGRINEINGSKGGLIWIEAPGNLADRRDLTKWEIHDIDPDQYTAHAFVFTDIDVDGDDDIVLANADFDTPENEEKVLWYENPGTGTAAQKAPWPVHVIYQGSEFYYKPQVAVADLNGDGLEDLLTQTEHDIYYFKKTGTNPVTWERIVIPKYPVAQWLARPIKVADINGDGRLDIFGMLTHKDGDLPGNKASAFWMEYSGDEPRPENWTTHVIKWGPGKVMLLPQFGEKWDQVDLIDVDGDGDLDIVANCEEWWEDDLEFRMFWDPKVNPNSVAVVWFENRLNEEPYTFEEKDGVCAMEAEHYTDLKDGTWLMRTRYEGYSGDSYVQDHNVLNNGTREWSDTAGLEYAIHVKGGTYYFWMRRWVPSHWGYRLTASNSNSTWLGVDGEPIGGVFDEGDGGSDQWSWVEAHTAVVLSPGAHVVNLRVAEGGYAVDRILLTTDATFIPSGTGPEETVANH